MTAEGSSIPARLSTRPCPKLKEPHGVEMSKPVEHRRAGGILRVARRQAAPERLPQVVQAGGFEVVVAQGVHRVVEQVGLYGQGTKDKYQAQVADDP